MTDPNRPYDPGQPQQPPSAGSPYGPPEGYAMPGQQNTPPYAPPPGASQQPPYGTPQPPPSPYGAPQQPHQGYTPPPGMPAGGAPGQPPGGPGQPPAGPGWGPAPYSQPPQQPGQKNAKVPLMIGGAVVVVIALIIGMMQLFNRGGGSTTGTPTESSSPQPTASATGGGVGAGSATEVVQKYFDALAAGDPDTIFGLVRGDLPDRTFLTKEVMTAAVQAAPISNLKLTELKASNYSAEIEAEYTINSRTQRQKFYVSGRDNQWYLTTIAARLYVKGLNPVDTGLTVNGIAVPDTDSISVFPGGYTLGTTNDTFALNKDKVVVEALTSSTDVFQIRTVLTAAALKDFKAATTSLVNTCKKPGAMRNAKCNVNFRQPSGQKIKNSTIRCTPSGLNSINRMKPTVDTSDLTTRASLSVRFECRMSSTKGRAFRGYSYLYTVYGQKTDAKWTVTAQRP